MKRKQLVSGVPIAGVALSLMATPAVGQESPLLDFQLHVGRGDGYVSSVTYGADLAWNISDWAAIQGSIGRWHSFFVDLPGYLA